MVEECFLFSRCCESGEPSLLVVKPRFPLAEAGPAPPSSSGDFLSASSGGRVSGVGQKRGMGCHSVA